MRAVGFSRGIAMDFKQILFNGATVDPHPDRNLMDLGRIHDPGQFGRAAKIAGIDADGLGAIFHGGHGQTMIKVDIGDQGNRDRRPDPERGRPQPQDQGRQPGSAHSPPSRGH